MLPYEIGATVLHSRSADDLDAIAGIMCRSDDLFHRALGTALKAGTVVQRCTLESAFPDLFSAFRVAIAAETEVEAARKRAAAEYQRTLVAAGLKIGMF